MCVRRMLQEQRRKADPHTAALLDDFLDELDRCKGGDKEFTVHIDDPAGNSYVESPEGNIKADRLLKVRRVDDERNHCRAGMRPAGVHDVPPLKLTARPTSAVSLLCSEGQFTLQCTFLHGVYGCIG